MTGLIRIPQKFYDDHTVSSIPIPRRIKTTRQHYYLDEDDILIHDLLSNAEFYADPWGPEGGAGLKASAKATVKAIRANEKWATVESRCNDELYDAWEPAIYYDNVHKLSTQEIGKLMRAKAYGQ